MKHKHKVVGGVSAWVVCSKILSFSFFRHFMVCVLTMQKSIGIKCN
jgi:hypothetical protein